MKVGLITTWDDLCGIASYSRLLVPQLERHVTIGVIPIDAGVRSEPGAYARVAREANGYDLVHLQHEGSFFGPGFCRPGLAAMVPRWIAPGVGPSAFPRLVASLNVPLVVTVHELPPAIGAPGEVTSPGPRWARAINRRCLRRSLARASAILVHSSGDFGKLTDMGLDQTKLHVVGLGIPQPGHQVDRRSARGELGLEGRFVLLMFGFVNWRKAHRTVVDLLPQLPEDVMVLIAGAEHPQDDSGYAESLRAHVASLGLADRVKFTGELSERGIAAVHAAADLAVVVPDDMPGGSASLTTSLGYRLPVVGWGPTQFEELARRVGGIRVVPQGDTGELLSSLRRYHDDGELLEQLRGDASNRAGLGYADQADVIAGIYRAVLPGEPQRYA